MTYRVLSGFGAVEDAECTPHESFEQLSPDTDEAYLFRMKVSGIKFDSPYDFMELVAAWGRNEKTIIGTRLVYDCRGVMFEQMGDGTTLVDLVVTFSGGTICWINPAVCKNSASSVAEGMLQDARLKEKFPQLNILKAAWCWVKDAVQARNWVLADILWDHSREDGTTDAFRKAENVWRAQNGVPMQQWKLAEPPPPFSCPAGQEMGPAGQCIVKPTTCPPGTTLVDGKCVPSSGTTCPPGTTKAADGSCVPPVTCPSGQVPDGKGGCVPGSAPWTTTEIVTVGLGLTAMTAVAGYLLLGSEKRTTRKRRRKR